MAQIITTGAHPKALWPGISAWWGREYDQHETQWTQLVDEETSDKAYEELVEDVGFGLPAVKPQGESIIYDTDSQGAVTRLTHVAYALGFMISFEEFQDNQYVEVAKRRAPDLAFSMRQGHENVVAAIFDRAFNSNYTGGDGVAFASSAHPTYVGNQSNLLTAADMSEKAIEDGLIAVMKTQDSRGRRVNLKAVSLHAAPANFFEANRIVKSVLQNDTANNAVNVIRLTGQFPKGIHINNYFTDTDNWFIRTNARHGLKHFQRDPVKFEEDGAFDNKVQKYSAYERFSVKWGDWRAYFQNNGPS